MKPRPTSLTVFAVFHFILGGLGLCCGIFNIGASALAYSNTGTGSAGGPSAGMAAAQNQYLDANAPHWKEIALALNLVDFAISALMIVAGVGLLQMKPWGRTLSLAYGGVSLVYQIGRLIYTFGFFLPVMDAFLTAYAPSVGAGGAASQAVQMAKSFLWAAAAINLIGLVYPTIVLIFMLRPSASGLFRGETTSLDDYGYGPGRGGRDDDRGRIPPGYGQEPPGYGQGPPPGYGGEPDDRIGPAR